MNKVNESWILVFSGSLVSRLNPSDLGMVEKPDVYICQNKECQNRFQKAKFVTVEEEGVYITKPSCPKCGTTDIISSAWLLREEE